MATTSPWPTNYDLGRGYNFDVPSAVDAVAKGGYRYGDPSMDWQTRLTGGYAGESPWWSSLSLQGQNAWAGSRNPLVLRQAAGPASLSAYSNLIDLLQQNGKTDPRLMNSIMSGIQRDTQSAQGQVQGQAARAGFQNSGVSAAIQAALGNAGMSKQADVRAQDAALQFERQQKTLDLFRQLIQQPSLDLTAMASGQYNADRQANAQKSAANSAALGSLLGVLGIAAMA